jgi:hypothetical protein
MSGLIAAIATGTVAPKETMSGLIAAIATGTVAVAGSVSSFAQASKQRKKMDAAQQEARKAMTEAKKRLDINVMEGLSVQKEPYELAREAALVQGASGPPWGKRWAISNVRLSLKRAGSLIWVWA